MKVLVATEKPFAPVAVEGIRKEVEGAGHELVLLEKISISIISHRYSTDYLQAVWQRYMTNLRCLTRLNVLAQQKMQINGMLLLL